MSLYTIILRYIFDLLNMHFCSVQCAKCHICHFITAKYPNITILLSDLIICDLTDSLKEKPKERKLGQNEPSSENYIRNRRKLYLKYNWYFMLYRSTINLVCMLGNLDLTKRYAIRIIAICITVFFLSGTLKTSCVYHSNGHCCNRRAIEQQSQCNASLRTT